MTTKEVKVGSKIALVDEDAYNYVSLFKWQILPGIKTEYATAHVPKYMGGKGITMHGLIVYVINKRNHSANREIDHIDGNGLNNCYSNLRLCTKAQNQANQRKRSDYYASNYKGVKKHPYGWTAGITVDRKGHYLGFFKNQEDAARAYDAKAFAIFGQFAALNFPEALKETNS